MAELWRGAIVESHHRGRAVVVDRNGRVLAGWGDTEAPVYPRSALKAVQALPLLETGAFDGFALPLAALALACGSHHGEPRHLAVATRWLATLGCGPDDLQCGAHPPFDETATVGLWQNGRCATALHNNCSGKHLGMLTTARHCREPFADYIRPDHPVQRRIAATVAELTEYDPPATGPAGVSAIDGCGVPTPALSLRGLATAMARFADPTGLPPSRVAAIERIRKAWRHYPGLIGGRSSFDTRIMLIARGAVLVKSGAEAVAVAALPALKLGVALKIDDGTPRAKNVALMAVLSHFGLFGADGLSGRQSRHLAALATPLTTNWAGTTVGELRPAVNWLSQKHERE